MDRYDTIKDLENAIKETGVERPMLKVKLGNRIIYVTNLDFKCPMYCLQVYKENGCLRYGKWGHKSEWFIEINQVINVIPVSCESHL